MKFEVSSDARKRYLTRRKADLVELQSAQSANDFERIRALAHQLKGNGTTFGFPEMTEHARTLEMAAIGRDAGKVDGEIAWMDSWLRGHLEALSLE